MAPQVTHQLRESSLALLRSPPTNSSHSSLHTSSEPPTTLSGLPSALPVAPHLATAADTPPAPPLLGVGRKRLANPPHAFQLNPAEDLQPLDTVVQCKWHEGQCNHPVRVGDAWGHIQMEHWPSMRAHAHVHPERKVTCRWVDCGQELTFDSIKKHIMVMHFDLRVMCIYCGNRERQDSYQIYHGLAKDCPSNPRNRLDSSAPVVLGGQPDATVAQPSPSTSSSTTPSQSPPSGVARPLRTTHRAAPYPQRARPPAMAGESSLGHFLAPGLQGPAQLDSLGNQLVEWLSAAPVDLATLSLLMPYLVPQSASAPKEEGLPAYHTSPSDWQVPLAAAEETSLGIHSPPVEIGNLTTEMPSPAPHFASDQMDELWPAFFASPSEWQVSLPAADTEPEDTSLFGMLSPPVEAGILTTESPPQESSPGPTQESAASPSNDQTAEENLLDQAVEESSLEQIVEESSLAWDFLLAPSPAAEDMIDFSSIIQANGPVEERSLEQIVEESSLALQHLLAPSPAAEDEIDFSSIIEANEPFPWA